MSFKPLLFDVKAYNARTYWMSAEEHGACLLLLFAIHAAEYGTIPYDPKLLARITRTTERKWARLSGSLMWLFKIEGDRIGLFDSWADIFFRRRLGIGPSLKAEIVARDGLVCTYCGTEEGPFDIDHVHPISKGGTNDPANLAVACAACNRSKGARSLHEWRGPAQ